MSPTGLTPAFTASTECWEEESRQNSQKSLISVLFLRMLSDTRNMLSGQSAITNFKKEKAAVLRKMSASLQIILTETYLQAEEGSKGSIKAWQLNLKASLVILHQHRKCTFPSTSIILVKCVNICEMRKENPSLFSWLCSSIRMLLPQFLKYLQQSYLENLVCTVQPQDTAHDSGCLYRLDFLSLARYSCKTECKCLQKAHKQLI